jgi:hypothetical protein
MKKPPEGTTGGFQYRSACARDERVDCYRLAVLGVVHGFQ